MCITAKVSATSISRCHAYHKLGTKLRYWMSCGLLAEKVFILDAVKQVTCKGLNQLPNAHDCCSVTWHFQYHIVPLQHTICHTSITVGIEIVGMIKEVHELYKRQEKLGSVRLKILQQIPNFSSSSTSWLVHVSSQIDVCEPSSFQIQIRRRNSSYDGRDSFMKVRIMSSANKF